MTSPRASHARISEQLRYACADAEPTTSDDLDALATARNDAQGHWLWPTPWVARTRGGYQPGAPLNRIGERLTAGDEADQHITQLFLPLRHGDQAGE